MTADAAAHPHRHPTWKWLVAIALLALMLTAGALIVTDPGDNIVLESSGVRTDATGQRVVTGSFRNRTTDRTYDVVRIDVELLTATDSVVDTLSASTRELEPGESWTFTIPAPQPEGTVARFRLARLYCEIDGRADARMCSIGAPLVVK